MIILGIDPGSVRIGYGVIRKKQGQLIHLESGLLKLPQADYGSRLVAIEEELSKLLKKTQPSRVGLEKLFFVKNVKTALDVAQARGVIISAITRRFIPLFEVAPSEVKVAVAGDGGAPKGSVAKMVNYILDLQERRVVDDITDALAVAIAISNLRDN